MEQISMITLILKNPDHNCDLADNSSLVARTSHRDIPNQTVCHEGGTVNAALGIFGFDGQLGG
jgi:hypothetical protein